MERRDVRCLLVVESGRLVGMVERHDLEPSGDSDTVSDRMATDFRSISAATSVASALTRMQQFGIYLLPVLAGDVLVGLITRFDAERGTQSAE